MLGEWTKDLDRLQQEFASASPYRHVLIENFFDQSTAEALWQDYPELSDQWHRYNNPIEIKYAFDDLSKMPPSFANSFQFLSDDSFIQYMRHISGICNLEKDPYYHGAGIHYMPRNGKLAMHLDYSIHPITGKERRLNLIFYVNKGWEARWGGQIEMWNHDMTECVKSVNPMFNSALLFETNDISWHGIPNPIQCPEGVGRKSLAIYYVSDARENIVRRPKALFVNRPNEPNGDRIKPFLEIRKNRLITKEDIERLWPEFN